MSGAAGEARGIAGGAVGEVSGVAGGVVVGVSGAAGGVVAAALADDLMDAFAKAVCERREEPAILRNGRSISYEHLDALVRSAALALGPDPGTVGVFCSHAPSTVVGLLAVLAAGGAYCPIDPSFPPERRDAMLAAVGCRTVLTADGTPVANAGIRVLNPAVSKAASDALTAPSASPDPTAPAYILFTSGSTGDPKPVVTPRVAISIVVAALRESFELTAADRVLQFASLNWDTCFEEILPTLTAGATLVFDDEAHTGSFPRFLRMIADRGVTVLDLPTAFWHELVRHLTEDADECRDGDRDCDGTRAALPSCLRLVVIGGEAAAPARVAAWHRLAGASGIRLVNTYGCTETTLITHAVDLERVGGSDPARIPIGRALPHVRELITDEGELLIGGPALALGYLDRPQATTERFVELGDGRFFRTGDVVSRDPEGVLFHEGRLDHQVKVRGIRVDPGEVEAHLTRHPTVAAAAVTGVTLAGRTALVAYVVAGRIEADTGPRDSAPATTDLLAWLRQRVPAHLVPSRITFVPELAHTASGKVDRAGTHRRYAPDGRPPQDTGSQNARSQDTESQDTEKRP